MRLGVKTTKGFLKTYFYLGSVNIKDIFFNPIFYPIDGLS